MWCHWITYSPCSHRPHSWRRNRGANRLLRRVTGNPETDVCNQCGAGGSGSCSSRGYPPGGSRYIATIAFTKRYWFWSQIVSLRDVDSLGDLDIGQKRALICRELERTFGRTRNTANILLCELAIITIHYHD
jgi:hypothetical protein